MNTQTNDGGPAFPRTVTINDGIDSYREKHNNGMTLHDYFTGEALMGILANPNIHPGEVGDKYITDLSLFFANAMLAARERKEGA